MSIQGLNLSTKGMLISQSGLRVTSNNIANVNTENYTKKRIVQDNLIAKNFTGVKKLATDIDLDRIERVKNQFFEVQYANNISQLGFFERITDISEQVNKVLGTASEQLINERLKSFFKSANALASSPTDLTYRRVFIDSAVGLTNSFNLVDDNLAKISDGIYSQANGELKKSISLLNRKLNQLSVSQRQINSLRVSNIDVSSFEDKRDVLVREIREISDLNIKTGLNGDVLEVNALSYSSPNEEPIIRSNIQFSDINQAIVPAISSGNRVLNLSVNDGNTNINTFTVNLPENANPRQAVESINEHFRANGGKGTIASINNDGQITFSTKLVRTSSLNASTSISILNPSPASASLGFLSIPTTATGKSPLKTVLMDPVGVKYTLDLELGNDRVQDGVNPTRVILKDAKNTKYGIIDIKKGDIGAQIEAIEETVPNARQKLNSLAMNIKDIVNGLISVGSLEDNLTGPDLFTGNSAEDFGVNMTLVKNINELVVGEYKDAIQSGIINLNQYSIDPYNGLPNQDISGTATVSADGTTLTLDGNNWKKIEYPYTITPNTILEFDFSSNNQREIHAIGFDNDFTYNPAETFELYGYHTGGGRIINPSFTYTGAGATQSIRIPVGAYYTGAMDRLFFINDDDLLSSANSQYSNIKVFESTSLKPSSLTAGENTIISKIAELFNGNSALLSPEREVEQLYLKSSDNQTKFSRLPINPNTSYQINIKGLIKSHEQNYNAGTNALGGDSLVQVQFYDESYNPIGTPQNLSGAEAPNQEANWSGLPPANAAFIGVSMNSVSFSKNFLTDNSGHFQIEVIPSTAKSTKNKNLQRAYSELVLGLNNDYFNAEINSESYNSVIQSINAQIASMEGVSLEEEAANLIRYQRTFSANARAFSAIDQSLEDIFRFL